MADAVIQLRELQARFGELQAACREKDEELRELRDVAEAATVLQAQDVQTAKIIDLSKKSRQLAVLLEKEKTRANKLQADLNATATASSKPSGGAALPSSAVEGIARQMVEQAAEAAEAATKQADMWKDRCQQQTNKMAQLEQKAFNLEIELRKLTRALQREVGDDVPLAKVLDEGSSEWKGRREQIIALRNQVQALKAAQGLAPEPRHEVAGKKVLAKVVGSKNAELEQLRAELAVAQQEAEAQRTRAEGALSRRKILEAELGGLKEKVAVVLAKTQNDDRLISALRAELALSKKQQAEAASKSVRPPVEQDDELWCELGMLRRRCGEQQAQIQRYEGTIQQLGDKLAATQQQGSGAGPHVAGCSNGSWAPALPSPTAAATATATGWVGSASRAGPAGSRGGTPPSTRLSAPLANSGVLGDDGDNRPSSSRGLAGGAAGDVGQLTQVPSAGRSMTSVEVRSEAVDVQLRLAQVEVARLQELVQLLQRRIQELEDELVDVREGG